LGSGGSLGVGGTVGLGGSVATGVGGALGSGGATGGSFGTGGSSGTVAYPAKFVGNIDTRGSVRSDFVTYWNQFAPENAGKWASIQATQSTFNWTSLDAMYKYCDEHNIIFKEHTFIWGAAQPSWMGSLTTTTGPTVVQTWMKTFCDRYPNTRLIDVVNEPPPHTTPPFKNVIGGSGSTGWDWIVNSFVWAHEACPNAVLILNDYNNAEYSSDAQHTIDIVKALQQAGAPIDAVGCQTHGASKLPSTTLKANIDLIAGSTGLPVYITEYDINLSDDALQKQQYEDHFTMFWSNPNVKGITVWGYVVGATWQTSTGILTNDGTMRPAMSWLMDFLGR
jgi:endo-1,4-beta-xylanase